MHRIHADPGLAEQSPVLEKLLADTVDELTPDDLRGLIDPLLQSIFSASMAAIGSDSATVWIADKERTKLTAFFVDREPKLVGREQPLDEGLISLVLASEQAICENQVYKHAQHSKLVDQALGIITCAMIAVPFYLGGQVCGVMSCVKIKRDKNDPDPDGFTGAHLTEVQRLSKVVERLVNFRLVQILADLHI